MNEKVITSFQLKNELTKNLENFKAKVGNEDIRNEEYQLLVETLIGERELMIEELDYLLYSHNRYSSFNLNDMTLLINIIDEETINILSVQAKKLGMNLPQLINILMEIVNDEFDESFPTLSSNLLKQKLQRFDAININHLKFLKVAEDDLIELDKDDLKVNFNHIGQLDLTDISFDSFVKYVSKINHCKHIIIPDEWSKLIIYFKSNWCKYFEFV